MQKIARVNILKSIAALVVTVVWYTLCYGIFWSLFLFPLFIIIAIIIFPEMNDCVSLCLYLFTMGIIVALIIFYIGYFLTKDRLFQIPGCKMYQVDESEYMWLYDLIKDIATFYGLKNIPKLYFSDFDISNIYSYGIDSKSASIVISKGLLDLLSEDELKSVIAHEISHILNRDTTYIFYSGILHNIPQNLSNELDYEKIRENKTLDYSRAKGLAVILLVINKIINLFGKILFKFISKNKEYLADFFACLYVKNPNVLANALTKIEENISRGNKYIVKDIIGASFIVPLTNDIGKYHPSTRKRIEMLLNRNPSCYKDCEKKTEG